LPITNTHNSWIRAITGPWNIYHRSGIDTYIFIMLISFVSVASLTKSPLCNSFVIQYKRNNASMLKDINPKKPMSSEHKSNCWQSWCWPSQSRKEFILKCSLIEWQPFVQERLGSDIRPIKGIKEMVLSCPGSSTVTLI